MVATGAPQLQHRAQSTADRVALTAVCVAPAIGVVAKMSNPGWMVIFLVAWSPVVLGFSVWGIVLFVRVFGPTSVVRDRLRGVPRRYRVAAWAWATGLVLPFVVILDGGDSGPWESVLTRVLGLGPEPDGYYVFQSLAIGIGVVAVITIDVVVSTWSRRDRTG